MALSSGARLGPYEVLGPIGAGGMGEVYRARDTRLGREVALKVLPAHRLADQARRARLAQEARAASALNHPNIVTIHEIEHAEGVDFIVMELIPGKTLDALIPRQGMRLGEALRIAIPLADALAAAHGAGIVHRDLKPANVMVTPDGVVKVLDFGLAKLTPVDEESGEDATTLDARLKLSHPGTVAGTPAYMSPEQASGGAVDARSDVFSFGAVLYEMVTGRRPFGGSSSAEVLASLLKDQPQPPSELVPEVPRDLERIVLRCLRKEPERRFQHMLDAKIELQEAKEESDSQATAPGGAAVARRRSRRRAVAWTAAAILILATATGVALWRLRRPELPAPRLVQLTWSGHESQATFSPDGSQIAFKSDGDDGDRPGIWLKIVGTAEARRLVAGPVDGGPAWSPDGEQIAFARSASGTNSIRVVSPLGVSERRLLDFPAPGLYTGYQLPWSPDGRWLAAARGRTKGDTTPESGGIHLVPVGGGEPHAVTFPKPPALDVCPAFSPDGRALAYATCERWAGGGAAACDINIMTLDTRFRPAAAARRLPGPKAWVQGLAWTRDGRSIVFGVNEIPRSYLWRVRADGTTPPERVELAGRGAVYPSTAQGRDRLAFVRNLWDVDIHRVQLGSPPAPLIQSTFNEYYPQYSPDGRRIAFESGRSGDAEEIWLAEADGSNPTQLTHGPGRGQGAPRWSPDGRSIAFDSRGEDGHSDIWTIGVDGAGLQRVTRDPSDESIPSWSRDGRLLYFTSTRAGHEEVWRAPAAGGAEERVTREGGCAASESLDGRLLYYVRTSANGALLVRPTAGGEERTIARCADMTNHAVGPQGVFYVGCNPPEAPFGSHRVVRHWDAATGRDRPVAEIEGGWVAGLSVSPDGRTIAWGRSLITSDLMMIEDFR